MNHINEAITNQHATLFHTPLHTFHSAGLAVRLGAPGPVLTQFGEMVDVRKRGALRIMRLAGAMERNLETPAVVRLWHEERCRELTTQEARRLANQLLAAADLADSQNQ
ncbi:MAG: hypothetical protein HYZ45_04430 [Burkholderiales bacterium]|nr:hypothetical protein [Burkholderiales bacterium]